MHTLLSRLALLLALTVGPFLCTAHAAVSADEAREVRAVVQAQLAAFAADDAERAFSFATPGLRQQFGSAAVFLQMVRSSYPVVYRASAVTFLMPESDNEVVVLPVQMTDARGATWLAIYKLARIEDRSWRIAGCVLRPHKDRTV